MDKKEQVEKKIRQACPELMELSFGCLAMFGKGVTSDNGEYTILRVLEESIDCVCIEDKEYRVARFHGETLPKEFEIIGHPIHLEHVLRAVDKHSQNNEIDVNKIFNIDGQPKWSEPLLLIGKIIDNYDLLKPFSEQDLSVYKLLDEIL